MKQITIEQLLPLLKKGYVAMDENGKWYWHEDEPTIQKFVYGGNKETYQWNNSGELFDLSELFNIAPFDGDWKQSLRRVVNSQKDTKKVVNSKTKKRVHKLDNNKIQAKQLDDNELQAKYNEFYRFAPNCFGFLTPEQIKEDFERWKRRKGHK